MKKILLLAITIVVLTGCGTEPLLVEDPFYDEFAACITLNGAKMYGSEYCSHCKNQKKAFNSSFQYINYIDCGEEKEKCADAGIEGYPTWIINGEKFLGEQSLELLAEKTECELPIKE